MPHFIIEYSQSLEQYASKMLKAIFQAAGDSGLFQPEDVKVRAQAFSHYLNGYNQADFIHLVIKLMPGRTAQQHQALSQAAAAALYESITSPVPSQPVVISSEVIELKQTSYHKLIKE